MEGQRPPDLPPPYPGPPLNNYGGMAAPPKADIQATPYTPPQPDFQANPYPPPQSENQPPPYPPPQSENQAPPYPPPQAEKQGPPYPPLQPENQATLYPPPQPENQATLYPPPQPENQAPPYPPPQPEYQATLYPPPQPQNQAPPYPPFQPGPYQGGPAPGGYPDAHQDYTGQPGPQQTGANINVHIREFIREVHIEGPAPEGYPSASQYYPGQPGPQQMGPAPGASPQWATVEPQLENVDQCHITTDDSKVDKKRADSDNCCKLCCLKTRRCLMSPECGRCLEIASVIAMCGMCFRFFI